MPVRRVRAWPTNSKPGFDGKAAVDGPVASAGDRLQLELEVGCAERDGEVSEEGELTEEPPAVGPRITEPDLGFPAVATDGQTGRDERCGSSGSGDCQAPRRRVPAVDPRQFCDPAGHQRILGPAVDETPHADVLDLRHRDVEQRSRPAALIVGQVPVGDDHDVDSIEPASVDVAGTRQTVALRPLRRNHRTTSCGDSASKRTSSPSWAIQRPRYGRRTAASVP